MEGIAMESKKDLKRISDIEKEIALLPAGSITKKTINGKDYYYHRINTNGKRIEKYVDFKDVLALEEQIKKRKTLEKELKELSVKTTILPVKNIKEKKYKFNTVVRYGELLKSQIAIASKYNKREIISELRDYVFGKQVDKVFVLYGLRRTGKTTLIRQIISELSDDVFRKAAFIQLTSKDTISDLDEDLRKLEQYGFKYVFIDEVTLMEDFIDGAALFSDIYVSSGMKIVLSGTDSLGFAFTKGEELYDRCIMLHTTFIPYREFERVLGIKGIEEYIKYGGTMSLSGLNYNVDSTFANDKSTEEYIDTAIAKNIQHSLKLYQYGGHFRHLLDLYEKGELTNVINRVVEDINHRFTIDVVERAFKSRDISVTSANLLRDRSNPTNIKKKLDIDSITKGIKQMLDILNKEEQSVDIDEGHMSQIKEYLNLLDLTMDIDLRYIPQSDNSRITVIAQPGLRYAQAEIIVKNILNDASFHDLDAKERKLILERLVSEICGRMMEEIVLLETKLANPNKEVFKLQFAVGEFDMVVFDPVNINCEIYEVKYSKEVVKDQYRHLVDEEKCKATAHRYGDILAKYVIYRGEKKEKDGIQYIPVEAYLKSLC